MLARRVPWLAHRVVAPPPAWGAHVQATRATAIPHFAQRHGLTVVEYERRVFTILSATVPYCQVCVRLPYEALVSVLQDGRVRNQFETRSSGGTLNPTRRLMVEQIVLGVPLDAVGRDRPVYGYLRGSSETSPVLMQYGEVVLRLRPELRHRTTFTFGDSLDHTLDSSLPRFLPSVVAEPSLLSLDPLCDFLAASELHQAVDPAYGYVEAQIHGDLTPSDVHEIVFTTGRAPDRAMLAHLQGRGIEWRTVQGDDPDGT